LRKKNNASELTQERVEKAEAKRGTDGHLNTPQVELRRIDRHLKSSQLQQ
jgi:hypothetical protein